MTSKEIQEQAEKQIPHKKGVSSFDLFRERKGFIEGAKWMQEREKKMIVKLRNELYEAIPIGKIDAFDLILIINNHIKKLDEITT